MDVFHALQRGHRIFEFARDFGFQLRRGGAGEFGTDDDDGKFDIGKVLHGVGAEGQNARQRQQHKQHDCRHRVLDGERGEVHNYSLFSSSRVINYGGWRPV